MSASVRVTTVNGDARGPRGWLTMTDYGPRFDASAQAGRVTSALAGEGL